MVVMPNEVLAQQQTREQWGPLQQAYTESVEQIFALATPAEIPALLQEATAQLMRHASKLQKVAEAQALVQKLRQGAGANITIKKQEAGAMAGDHNTVAGSAMELIAKGLVSEGKAATMREALEQVNREYPDLWRTHVAEMKKRISGGHAA